MVAFLYHPIFLISLQDAHALNFLRYPSGLKRNVHKAIYETDMEDREVC